MKSSKTLQLEFGVTILTEPEREQLIVVWNRTETEFPFKASVPEIFEKQAADSPDSVAILHNSKALTYLELLTSAPTRSRAYYAMRAAGQDLCLAFAWIDPQT